MKIILNIDKNALTREEYLKFLDRILIDDFIEDYETLDNIDGFSKDRLWKDELVKKDSAENTKSELNSQQDKITSKKMLFTQPADTQIQKEINKDYALEGSDEQ